MQSRTMSDNLELAFVDHARQYARRKHSWRTYLAEFEQRLMVPMTSAFRRVLQESARQSA